MRVKFTIRISILLLSTFVVGASPLPLFEESTSLNLRSIPNRGEQVDSSAGSLIVARAPDGHTPTPEDVAETYLKFLLSTVPNAYIYKDYIPKKRDEIYQDGKVNAAAFPPDWLDAKGQLYIPDSKKRYFKKSPSWNDLPRPLHFPKNYNPIIPSVPSTEAPTPDDVAETYLAYLWSSTPNADRQKDYIADKRNEIYQGGEVNAAAFPPDWLDAKGELYIPDSEKRFFKKAPCWNHLPHPLHSPEDYKTIIQTNAPMWLHQLISPDWVDTALLDKHWDKGFEYHWNRASSGQNVWVYVFDSGIDIHNEEFENRATIGWSFDGDHQDKYGHGTACASQIGGKRFGVAKKVNLVSIRVLNDNGYGTFTALEDGMDYVLKCKDHKAPCVISMSMGPLSTKQISEAAIEKIKELTKAGIHIVASAGNSHSNIISGAEVAGLPDVITVGALDPKRNYQPALHSNYGYVDMWVVATDICLLLIGTVKALCASKGRSTVTGTSFAAPPIAGMLASLISLEGNLEPAHMKEKIKRMALYGKIPNLKAQDGGGHNLRAYIPPRIYTPPAEHGISNLHAHV